MRMPRIVALMSRCDCIKWGETRNSPSSTRNRVTSPRSSTWTSHARAARERRGADGRPPSDCQRGECFSCAGRLLPNSTGAFTIAQPGGLETRLPERAAADDFVLACSMFITGPGVRVEFADEHVSEVWEALTAGFGDDAPGPAQGKGASAAARTIREYQEENLDEFIESIERVWERGSGEPPGR